MSDVVGPIERVIVVGAGIAGLATAARVTAAGVPCAVLEARDRIGGRLHTIDLAGVPVDLGGSWIHHPIGNPLTTLCDQRGIARVPGDPIPTLTAYDRAERSRLTHAEVADMLRLVFDPFDDSLDSLRDRLAPDATALDAIDTFLAEQEWERGFARRARQGLLAQIEADAADRADNEPLRWMGPEEQFGGDDLGDLPLAGYRSVIDALATGLDIRRGTEVVSVQVTEDGVRVGCADGTNELGSHAVVAVPLGVLKRGRPRFDPPLPGPVRTAVDALGFGRYEKIALRFESAFWRDEGLSHLMVFPLDPDEPALWVFDLDTFGAGPVLCAHLFPSLTPHALDHPPAEAVQWFRGVLAEAFGHAVPDPVASVVTSWSLDPFTCGAYSHTPVGADPGMHDAFAQPIHGRLLMAGEHTQSARYGYADGAYVSGLRAARLLGL